MALSNEYRLAIKWVQVREQETARKGAREQVCEKEKEREQAREKEREKEKERGCVRERERVSV